MHEQWKQKNSPAHFTSINFVKFSTHVLLLALFIHQNASKSIQITGISIMCKLSKFFELPKFSAEKVFCA